MKITFDKFADALYIQLKRGKVKKTLTKGNNFLVDLDGKGDVLGFEVLQYTKKIPSTQGSVVISGKKKLALSVS